MADRFLPPLKTPLEAGYRMPPEWAPHARCWMAWPARVELWGKQLGATQSTYAAVARAVARFEPVTLLVPPQDLENAAAQCEGAVDILPMDLDDSWTRDSGPNFVKNEKGELAASIFHFNAWGRKFERFGRDAAMGHRIAEYLGVPTFTSPLFMEGGGINVDGEGTVITSESCILNPNRNPRLTKAEAERELCRALGAKKVLWIPGDPTDQATDGHVDGHACFVRPGVVLVEICPDPANERYALLQENLKALKGATDAGGRPLEIVTINEAHEAQSEGDFYCISYINFYIANGGIVMPEYGIPGDVQAFEIISRLFPDREVGQVNIHNVAVGGGGIHCITQQQPA